MTLDMKRHLCEEVWWLISGHRTKKKKESPKTTQNKLLPRILSAFKQKCKYCYTGLVGSLGNPGYTSPHLCVHSVFLMRPVVAYSLHKSFISLAFLDVDCRAEVVTLLSQCVWGWLGWSKQNAFGRVVIIPQFTTRVWLYWKHNWE